MAQRESICQNDEKYSLYLNLTDFMQILSVQQIIVKLIIILWFFLNHTLYGVKISKIFAFDSFFVEKAVFRMIFYEGRGKKNINWSKMMFRKINELSRSFGRKNIIINQKLFKVCCWIEKVAHLEIFLGVQNSFGVAKTFMKF